MTHDEAQLLIGAVPGEVGPTLAEHLAGCPECTLFQQEMRRMDQDLARLMAAPLPPRAAARVVSLPVIARPRPAVSQPYSRVLALAASTLLFLGVSVLFWSLRPEPSLAAGVLQHVAGESASWSEVTPMTVAATDAVLKGAGVSLDAADNTVTYARTCLFNGHWVPHLVVQTASGPVTVMVLRQEHIAARQSFRQSGYSGILLPTPAGGTLAVIVRGDPDLDAVARAIGPHLRWAP